MNNFFRSLIAGYAGWKWGGGCLGGIIVFFIVFWLLGYMNCKLLIFFLIINKRIEITADKVVTGSVSAVVIFGTIPLFYNRETLNV